LAASTVLGAVMTENPRARAKTAMKKTINFSLRKCFTRHHLLVQKIKIMAKEKSTEKFPNLDFSRFRNLRRLEQAD
jgi:hypothetical protein